MTDSLNYSEGLNPRVSLRRNALDLGKLVVMSFFICLRNEQLQMSFASGMVRSADIETYIDEDMPIVVLNFSSLCVLDILYSTKQI